MRDATGPVWRFDRDGKGQGRYGPAQKVTGKGNRRSFHSAAFCRKTFPGKNRQTAGPSTALRSGRDDKGEGWRFQEPFFITLGGPQAHVPSGRDDKGEGRYDTELRSRNGLQGPSSLRFRLQIYVTFATLHQERKVVLAGDWRPLP